MPVSPDRARLLAKALLEIYQDAETQLLIRLAKKLAVGIDEPSWADRQLLAVQQLRLDTRQLLILLETKGLDALHDAILMAYNRGVALAGTDLMATGNHAAIAFGGVNTDAVRTLVTEGQRALHAMTLPIQSAQASIYSDVVRQTATRMLTGTVTRREASAQAIRTWAAKGITGFRDRAGRNWDMASYAEMVGRTTAGNAIVQGHVDRLVDNGHDLGIISDAPAECSACRPWEGKLVSLTGHSPPGRRGEFEIKGSLARAKDEGLFHPGCRHTLSRWIEGVTRPMTNTADPEGAKLREQQRAKERRIRALKREVLAVQELDPATAAKSRAQLRAYTQDYRSWIDENGLKRLAYREQLKAR